MCIFNIHSFVHITYYFLINNIEKIKIRNLSSHNSSSSLLSMLKFSCQSKIPYDVACQTLNFGLKLAYKNCVGFICPLQKLLSCKKQKFRHLNKRNCYEQR